jgi:hypothetical protein
MALQVATMSFDIWFWQFTARVVSPARAAQSIARCATLLDGGAVITPDNVEGLMKKSAIL